MGAIAPMSNAGRVTRPVNHRHAQAVADCALPGLCLLRTPLRETGRSVPMMPPRALINRMFWLPNAPFFYRRWKNLQLNQRLREVYIV